MVKLGSLARVPAAVSAYVPNLSTHFWSEASLNPEEKRGPWSLSTSLWCSPFSCSLPFFKGHNILDGRHMVILGINQMCCTSYLAQKGKLRSITGKNRRSVPSRRLCGALYLLGGCQEPYPPSVFHDLFQGSRVLSRALSFWDQHLIFWI